MSLVRRLLNSRPHVLVVGSDGEPARADQRFGSESDEYTVETVLPSTALDRAGELPVACVVLEHRAVTDDTDPVELIDRLSSVPNPPSVVFVAEDPGPTAVAATQTAPSVVLTLDDEQSHTDVIRTAVDRYLDRRSDALARTALDSLFEGSDRTMFLKDRSRTYLKYASDQDQPDPDAVVGQTDADLTSLRGFGGHWIEQDRRVLESGDPERGVVVEPEDVDTQFESTIVPWEDTSGSPVGVVGSRTEISDVTAREKRLERERERLEQLARYLTHDLKNPLVVADGYLELAKADGDEVALERIGDALDRMSDLIDDLSMMAQNRGQIETTIPQAELPALVSEVWEPLARDDPTADLDVEIPDGALITARAASLRPLLENLFKNALVHGRADADAPVMVTVGTLPDGFFVADDGPGIPEGEREAVFTEGYSSAGNRTGDGLAIVADVVESNDWRVAVTDSESGGARFEITDCLTVPDPDPELQTAGSLTLDQTVDIGEVSIPGEVTPEGADRLIVTAEGRDIWQDHNDFSFYCVAVNGPVRIQGRVPEIDAPEPFSKAGFMVRDELDPASAHAYIGRNADHVIELLRQETATGKTSGDQLTLSDDTQRLLRLDRVDDLVTCYLSDLDGEWQPIDQRRIDLEDTVYVGLAACSTAPGETSTATFEDVVVQRLEVD